MNFPSLKILKKTLSTQEGVFGFGKFMTGHLRLSSRVAFLFGFCWMKHILAFPGELTPKKHNDKSERNLKMSVEVLTEVGNSTKIHALFTSPQHGQVIPIGK